MTIARVGELAIPVLSADLVRVAQLLRASIDGSELADRIMAGLAENGELELEPRSGAEKNALELALAELTWEEPRGRLLPRLRAAVAESALAETPVTASLEQTLNDEARSAADARRTPRAQIKATRGEIEAETSR